ncbi:hypothetical protein [Tenacibaculum finnmarkense]|uniref:hypothetical protein n=1 Tax=Tenacibaculum finnmarkense TaxID=2781243 RepID=UPI000C571363|nr:hypothetical protein [Tenacibaculum finnmarkense]MCD8439977.1 hypothetical protein [Tenacibaculum finnmarkense genomovar ulcerans]MCG8208039.1 hypothetical protein [Tenacibaculum finnmarkense genomovar finnmarkense]MCG8253204.1 hypothetical protein [Tenacibaculum finnmarkense genomovar finnmarkense]MCG8721798.1 hypothetical protein [Tenacibaculum finnmarkense]MCG8816402.1 hypothetical protein [Tenacibaculum finnmarkense]
MIKKRIVQYLEFKGFSKYSFYKKTTLSNGSLDKKGTIGADKCELIYSVYPEINLEWLITGQGEMLKSAVIVEAPVVKEAIDYKEKYHNSLEENQDLNKENRLLYKENRSLRSEIDSLQKTLLDNNLGTNDMNRSVG